MASMKNLFFSQKNAVIEKMICNVLDFNYLFCNREQFEWPWMTFSGGSCHFGFDIMMQINNMISKGANNLNLGDFDQILFVHVL